MLRVVVAAAALALLAPAPAYANADAQVSATVLTARLSGADPDGKGSATLHLAPARGRICARLTWSGIAEPNAAHVHRVSDEFTVVDLASALDGSGCTTGLAPRLVRRIALRPGRFYVNLHNHDYMAEAIGGRLRR